ncbi:unnamed protein product [Agarophyton chilense]
MFKTLRQHLKHQGDEEKMKVDEKLRQIIPLLTQFNSQPSSKKPRLTLQLAVKNNSIFEDDDRRISFMKMFIDNWHRRSEQHILNDFSLKMRGAQWQREHLIRMDKLRNALMDNIVDDEQKRLKTAGDNLDDD